MLPSNGKGRRSYGIYVYITVLILGFHLVEYLYLNQIKEKFDERADNRVDSPSSFQHGDAPAPVQADVVEKSGLVEERERRELFQDTTQPPRGPVYSKFQEPVKNCRFGICYTDLNQVIAPEYDPRFKNPCWYQHNVSSEHQTIEGNRITYLTQLRNLKDGGPEFLQSINKTWEKRKNKGGAQFRCLPYFIILGQAKSGSTDLYARLQLHPQITLSRLKEPQWYTFKRFVAQEKSVARFSYRKLTETPIEDYISIFDGMSDQIENAPQIVTGDGSSNLFSWNYDWNYLEGIPREYAINQADTLPKHTIADQIKATNPTAKLLLMLRDPTDRLFSAYQYFPHLHSNKSLEDFHEDVVHDIATFGECRDKYNSRFCVYDYKLKSQLRLDIIFGLYSVFLQDWNRVFTPKQFKIINQNVYREEIGKTMDDIISFLELKSLDPAMRSMVVNMPPAKVTHGKWKDMLPETRELLNKFYKPYNKQLALLTGDKTFNEFGEPKPTVASPENPQAEAKATQPKAQPEAQPEAQLEAQPQAQPEAQSQAQAEAQPEAQPKAQPVSP